jgi:hypothetical protein
MPLRKPRKATNRHSRFPRFRGATHLWVINQETTIMMPATNCRKTTVDATVGWLPLDDLPADVVSAVSALLDRFRAGRSAALAEQAERLTAAHAVERKELEAEVEMLRARDCELAGVLAARDAQLETERKARARLEKAVAATEAFVATFQAIRDARGSDEGAEARVPDLPEMPAQGKQPNGAEAVRERLDAPLARQSASSAGSPVATEVAGDVAPAPSTPAERAARDDADGSIEVRLRLPAGLLADCDLLIERRVHPSREAALRAALIEGWRHRAAFGRHAERLRADANGGGAPATS